MGVVNSINMFKHSIRYGGVIRLRLEKYDEYKRLHASVWPKVLYKIHQSNIRNFTIYYSKELSLLFSHYEYIGFDYNLDMSLIEKDPTTKKWWKICENCQDPVKWKGPLPSEGGKGEWWSQMEELFHSGTYATQYYPSGII